MLSKESVGIQHFNKGGASIFVMKDLCAQRVTNWMTGIGCRPVNCPLTVVKKGPLLVYRDKEEPHLGFVTIWGLTPTWQLQVNSVMAMTLWSRIQNSKLLRLQLGYVWATVGLQTKMAHRSEPLLSWNSTYLLVAEARFELTTFGL